MEAGIEVSQRQEAKTPPQGAVGELHQPQRAIVRSVIVITRPAACKFFLPLDMPQRSCSVLRVTKRSPSSRHLQKEGGPLQLFHSKMPLLQIKHII